MSHLAATRAILSTSTTAHVPVFLPVSFYRFVLVAGALGFEGVCKLLVQARILTVEQAREAMVREDRERTLLVRQRTGRPQGRGAAGAQDAVVHPAEVLVAMDFVVSRDPEVKLSEKMVME